MIRNLLAAAAGLALAGCAPEEAASQRSEACAVYLAAFDQLGEWWSEYRGESQPVMIAAGLTWERDDFPEFDWEDWETTEGEPLDSPANLSWQVLDRSNTAGLIECDIERSRHWTRSNSEDARLGWVRIHGPGQLVHPGLVTQLDLTSAFTDESSRWSVLSFRRQTSYIDAPNLFFSGISGSLLLERGGDGDWRVIGWRIESARMR